MSIKLFLNCERSQTIKVKNSCLGVTWWNQEPTVITEESIEHKKEVQNKGADKMKLIQGPLQVYKEPSHKGQKWQNIKESSWGLPQ